MLRHYDDLGLLRPAEVDPDTGYRLYHHAQLSVGLLVRRLRDLEMPLSAITAVLGDSTTVDVSRVVAALRAHQTSLEADAQALTQRLAEAADLINQLEGETMRTFTLSQRDDEHVVSVREPLASYESEEAQWGRVMSLLGQSGIGYGDLTMAGNVVHDTEAKSHDCDVELWVQLREVPEALTPPLATRALPGGTVLSHIVTGGYHEVDFPAEWSALAAEAGRRGLAVSGPSLQRYLVGPRNGCPPQEYQTELCLTVSE